MENRSETNTKSLTSPNLNVGMALLEQYLEDYVPYTDEMTSAVVIFKTSEDIANELSEMVEISVNDISKVMLSKGYKACFLITMRGWQMVNISFTK